ncbi:MAG: glycosyltransferase family 39 protein [Melioribacteraceae bacterium]
MNKLSDIKINIIIALIAAVILIPFLGNVHLFDWDEINFAECAREMIVTKDYLRVQIDYQPFWEKPPLFIWCQALSMNLFGVNEFAARLPNALIGIISLLVLFNIGKKIIDTEFGITWVLVYLGSFLPHFYFRSGIIDPMFNFFMFLSIYLIFRNYLYQNKNRTTIVLAGLCSGLAVLTKGPVGFLLPSITYFIFWIVKRHEIKLPIVDAILFAISASFVSLIWFGLETTSHGLSFITEFIKYQIRLLTTGEASHGGPFYYHFFVLLIGCFPASVFIFDFFKKKEYLQKEQNDFRVLMVILLFVVFIIFSIVKTKIVHYSSLAYYPMTFLAASSIYFMIKKKIILKVWHYVALIFLGLLFAILFIGVPLLFIYRQRILPYITDKFVQGNLSMIVPWNGYEFLIGVLFLIGIIISIICLRKQKIKYGLYLLFLNVIIVIFLFLPVAMPKIEKHVQGAVIDFYESIINKDVYVNVFGMKSYAHLFYSKKKYENSAASLNMTQNDYEVWLKEGKVDKPVYFICKIQDKDDCMRLPDIELIKEEGGFVFFRRMPSKR